MDAKKQFPQGHGDAWGHYLSRARLSLQAPPPSVVHLVPRPEAVPVAERRSRSTSSTSAASPARPAARARAGAETSISPTGAIRRGCRRQWQGYKDTDTGRAWDSPSGPARGGWGLFRLGDGQRHPARNRSRPHAPGDPEDRSARPSRTGRDRLPVRKHPGPGGRSGQGAEPARPRQGVVPFDIGPEQVAGGKTTSSRSTSGRAAVDNAVSVWDYENTLRPHAALNQDPVEDSARMWMRKSATSRRVDRDSSAHRTRTTSGRRGPTQRLQRSRYVPLFVTSTWPSCRRAPGSGGASALTSRPIAVRRARRGGRACAPACGPSPPARTAFLKDQRLPAFYKPSQTTGSFNLLSTDNNNDGTPDDDVWATTTSHRRVLAAS